MTLVFSREVYVTTGGGTPSVGLDFFDGQERRAFYKRGSGTRVLVFTYTLTEADGSQSAVLLNYNSLALGGGTIEGVADWEAAVLAHDAVAQQGVATPGGPPPLTGAFTDAPAEHDGESRFEVVFELSERPSGASWRYIRDHMFTVTGGAITRARRTGSVWNKQWTLTVGPSGDVPVTLTLRDGIGCQGERGMCTPDGRVLEGGATVTIEGPAMLSVADATVEEAAGAVLDFVVTLSRARTESTSVGYATTDGTATAGEDYEAASDTLTFVAGETSKTVSVPVLDDAHDEGAETMTLTLSAPSPAAYVHLADAVATGTITNTDPMPKAWMVRFGRTVAGQALDAVTARLGAAPGRRLTVAGIALGGAPAPEPEADDDPFALPAWATRAREPEARTLTGADFVLGSRFHISAGDAAGGGAVFTAWGNAATGGFEAGVDDVAMDGEVTTGFVGFDAEWERALAGVMLSRSRGTGGYRLDAATGEHAGEVESALTGAWPYARIALTERLTAWGLAGAGCSRPTRGWTSATGAGAGGSARGGGSARRRRSGWRRCATPRARRGARTRSPCTGRCGSDRAGGGPCMRPAAHARPPASRSRAGARLGANLPGPRARRGLVLPRRTPRSDTRLDRPRGPRAPRLLAGATLDAGGRLFVGRAPPCWSPVLVTRCRLR